MSVVVTRMQDLASEFSKKISGVNTPKPPQWEGQPTHVPTPSPAHGRARPGVGTQTLVPLNFSAVVAPRFTSSFPIFLICS